MKFSEQIDKIAPAIVRIQKRIDPIAKNAQNPHFRSAYVTLDSLIEYLRPIAAEEGVAIVQGGGEVNNGGLAVSTTLLHESGQWISESFELPIEKNTPQAAGSSITYGRRYSLSSILSIASEEDDDGNAASTKRSGATAGAAASRTTNAPAASGSFVMPFGQSRGKPISGMSDKDLNSAIEWATEKKKFADFIVAANVELKQRANGRLV